MSHSRRSCVEVGVLLRLVVVLPSNAENPAATVRRDPGIDETVDHRVDPFGARTVLAQELRLLPDDQLCLELVDAATCCTELRGLARVDAGDLSAVDLVLLDPLRERDAMDVELVGGLVCGLPARTRAITRARNSGG